MPARREWRSALESLRRAACRISESARRRQRTLPSPLPAAPYLVFTDTGLRLPIFTADRPSIVIGRSDPLSGVYPDLDLQPFGAEQAGVSRRHARLTPRDDACWLEDLNSVNLTYLNDQRLAPDRPVRLKDGDLLRLGQLLITFRAG